MQLAQWARLRNAQFVATKLTLLNMSDENHYDGPNKLALALICFFFGALGIHRFIIGKIGTGILMLLTGGGFGIWWIIDLIMILTDNFKDKHGNKITT